MNILITRYIRLYVILASYYEMFLLAIFSDWQNFVYRLYICKLYKKRIDIKCATKSKSKDRIIILKPQKTFLQVI